MLIYAGHKGPRPHYMQHDVLRVARDMAAGLAYLHPGVVHRDLKVRALKGRVAQGVQRVPRGPCAMIECRPPAAACPCLGTGGWLEPTLTYVLAARACLRHGV